MAICKYCGRYHDPDEWPPEFRTAYTPNCCFKCFEENPDRAQFGHVDESSDDDDSEPECLDSDEELDEPELDDNDETDGE